jgi:hypothetical protein
MTAIKLMAIIARVRHGGNSERIVIRYFIAEAQPPQAVLPSVRVVPLDSRVSVTTGEKIRRAAATARFWGARDAGWLLHDGENSSDAG